MEAFEYDIFLSHSSKDKPAVRDLAKRLRRNGLRVWFDEWEIKPGDMIGLKIEEGLERSRTLVLVLSHNAFGSDWITLERHTALFRDPTNAERRFIPLRLDDANIKDALKQFAYVDWRQQSNEQFARLLEACRSAATVPRPELVQNQPSPLARVLDTLHDTVYGVAITSDGQRALSCSSGIVQVWDLRAGRLASTLKGHGQQLYQVSVTPDGQRAVAGSLDGKLLVWDVNSGRLITEQIGHVGWVWGVSLTPDGHWAASASADSTVKVWELETGHLVQVLRGHTDAVRAVALTADGQRAVTASDDTTVRVWDVHRGQCIATLEGHNNWAHCVAITPEGRRAVSGGREILLWDLETGQLIAEFEGHTDVILALALTPDGKQAVSGSKDGTVRVWNLEIGQSTAILKGHTGRVFGVAVTPDGQRIISVSEDRTVRVWELSPASAPFREGDETVKYTNAKVLLVGDSGVGKTGLAYRLTEDRFVFTISTDAAWATQLELPHEVGEASIEREIWLWDFAGQADYRLIHQLYMDEAALAILVFNPQSDNPFEGISQWDRDLQRAARRQFRKILVAGRCDRGGLMVSREAIERLCMERGFTAYLETSSNTGAGCKELREAIVSNIPWEDIPWVLSPQIFKQLKREILKLKDSGMVLLRMSELKQQLEVRLPTVLFTIEELRAIVRLLAGPGVVWQLEFGDFVLLQPERINSYAAAVIRSVRSHLEEIGCILEDRVLAADLDFQDLQRLPAEEEQIVVRAMHQTFIDYGLCLRERTDKGILLVFPSYFKRERPDLPNHPAIFVSYQFQGALDEVYSTLIVRLHHTLAFEKAELWRFAADFKTPAGKRIGLKMTKRGEGAAELAVYFELAVPEDVKVTFIRYVHEHLQAKASEVVRLRHYVCPYCGASVKDREAAWERLNRGLLDIVCQTCEERVPLWDLIEEKFASPDFQRRVHELEALFRSKIDNESRELILIGHAFAIAGEAGQIFRPTPNSDWGLDGEIEFKDYEGNASGKRIYLQLKSGDSYLYKRRGGDEIFTIKSQRHARYWRQQGSPVMLVIRTSEGSIRWMNVTEYLERREGEKVKQIVFNGEPFSALNLQRLRDRLLGPPPHLFKL